MFQSVDKKQDTAGALGKDLSLRGGFTSPLLSFRGLDKLGRLSAIFHKGDNFCDFLFAFLQRKPLLKYIAPDKALFFIQKVLIFFLFLQENIFCGYSLEVPH